MLVGVLFPRFQSCFSSVWKKEEDSPKFENMFLQNNTIQFVDFDSSLAEKYNS
jgi:hypothetical protein